MSFGFFNGLSIRPALPKISYLRRLIRRPMGMLIFYLLLALVVSFVCSVLESVLLSAPPSYEEVLRRQADERAEEDEEGEDSRAVRRRRKGAALFGAMKADVEKPLSSILSLNTIAHTVGAAGVGAQSIKVFGDVYAGLTSAVLTFLILILSEILPKSVGARYWKSLVIPACYVIRVLVWVCYPLVWLSEGIAYLVTRGRSEPSVSRQEVEAVVDMGSKEGILQAGEAQTLRSMLAFKDLRVRDIMTPRMVAVTVSENMTLRDFFYKKNYLKYSRIPVYKGQNPEHITGFVLLKDVFTGVAEDDFDKKLLALKRPLSVVSSYQQVPGLWERMRRRKEQIAMVVDEYGTFVGLVTMEDLIETMLGYEIVDEKDTITDLQAYARRKSGKQDK